MGFLAILNAYTMRISLSIAITELVVKKNHSDSGEHAVCKADDLDSGTSVSLKRVRGFFYKINISSFCEQIKVINYTLRTNLIKLIISIYLLTVWR